MSLSENVLHCWVYVSCRDLLHKRKVCLPSQWSVGVISQECGREQLPRLSPPLVLVRSAGAPLESLWRSGLARLNWNSHGILTTFPYLVFPFTVYIQVASSLKIRKWLIMIYSNYIICSCTCLLSESKHPGNKQWMWMVEKEKHKYTTVRPGRIPVLRRPPRIWCLSWFVFPRVAWWPGLLSYFCCRCNSVRPSVRLHV